MCEKLGGSITNGHLGKEMHRRAGIEWELESRVDHRDLKWFGFMEEMDQYRND